MVLFKDEVGEESFQSFESLDANGNVITSQSFPSQARRYSTSTNSSGEEIVIMTKSDFDLMNAELDLAERLIKAQQSESSEGRRPDSLERARRTLLQVVMPRAGELLNMFFALVRSSDHELCEILQNFNMSNTEYEMLLRYHQSISEGTRVDRFGIPIFDMEKIGDALLKVNSAFLQSQ